MTLKPMSEKQINFYFFKKKGRNPKSSHNTSARISLSTSCHTSKWLNGDSKWSRRPVQQRCVNADLQLPTKQREGGENGEGRKVEVERYSQVESNYGN